MRCRSRPKIPKDRKPWVTRAEREQWVCQIKLNPPELCINTHIPAHSWRQHRRTGVQGKVFLGLCWTATKGSWTGSTHKDDTYCPTYQYDYDYYYYHYNFPLPATSLTRSSGKHPHRQQADRQQQAEQSVSQCLPVVSGRRSRRWQV